MNCFESKEGVVGFRKAQAPDLFAEAMRIRTDVFVLEQLVPAEHELDALDEEAIHFLLPSSGQPARYIATGRLFAAPSVGEGLKAVKMGRMAVLASGRGQGAGRRLMLAMMEYAHKQGFQLAVLDAQVQAQGFYGQLGFEAEGETFWDEGILHIKMHRSLTDTTISQFLEGVNKSGS
jgi:predicted GNAT family N-acyltransferase